MRLSLLTELFDAVAPYHWRQEGYARFQIGDAVYEVDIQEPLHFGEEDLSHVASVSFAKLEHDGRIHTVTGSGQASSVLGTVVTIIHDYMRRHNTSILLFSAQEQNRYSLYLTMARKLTRQFEPVELPGDKQLALVRRDITSLDRPAATIGRELHKLLTADWSFMDV